MSELVNVKKGEGNLSLEVKDGKVVLSVVYDGKQADAKLEVSLDADEYLDMLKKAIPGQVDDMIIDGLKAMLKR